MNQEKVAKFIQEVRKKSNLSQEKFGEKYGVTYQAVSKWERGRNLPELLCAKKLKKNHYLRYTIIVILLIGVILTIFLIFKILNKEQDGFEFKTLTTSCDNFEIAGSMAYDDNKTSIYISSIDYCGVPNDTEYEKIKCTFYEINNDNKIKIDSYNVEDTKITLQEFLKQVKFNVNHYSDSCQMYKENRLFLEIEATNSNEETTLYDIPVELEENCK